MKTLGVIVGRFQVDQLHEGHKLLFDEAYRQCDHVMVVLGEGPFANH